MSHTPHELAADFPEHAEAISARRQSDAHFAKLADEYHTLNREVHRAETDVVPVSDERMNEMRKQRMALKDTLYGLLTKG
ncbi:YdcH family protein [Sulfitobacter sp. S190]|uniref:YdcH family protein n=1 Tax=Sulfitobacter sp. S190 TaxID=2867022 RepID=UPI0021A5EABD|nr:YdcH family protein [Sulfitobacter sp. S190]UWR22741.1 YdcH family protein [Sulfitobacter sp. S190]